MTAACILFQNADQTVTLIDIPGSIELAQGFQRNDSLKTLFSAKAIERPYPSIEPKSAKALANVGVAPVRDLLLQRYIEFALEEVQKLFKGSWCSPRTINCNASSTPPIHGKRQSCDVPNDESHIPRPWDANVVHQQPSENGAETVNQEPDPEQESQLYFGDLQTLFAHRQQFKNDYFHNVEKTTQYIPFGSPPALARVPPGSTYIHGEINNTNVRFKSIAPQFDLVIMDPPWPNRSARRKASYQLSYDTLDINTLLASIPITDHLAKNALVGIWVTNKSVFHDLILGPNGFFEKWGIDLVEEWVWLKVAASGEPICALQSAWRKPYEILLLGRKRGLAVETRNFKRKVIIGVPDLHSRKPNLKTLFEPILPPKYEALEIFARNLTASWWAWGDEVLKFQCQEHWTNIPE